LLDVCVEAPYNKQSTDGYHLTAISDIGTIGYQEVTALQLGDSYVQGEKFPLRWRGEAVRFKFECCANRGPQIMSGFTVYFTKHGVE
jgi:hypothetical protein